MVRPSVVRHEKFGPLIWSATHGAYFLPNDTEAAAITKLFLKAPESPVECGPDSAAVVRELRDLGLCVPPRQIFPHTDAPLSAPLDAYFDFTWVCNLAKQKCGTDSFCYASPYLGKTTMSPDHVHAVLSELHDWGVMRLHLAGGEPTVDKGAFAHYLDTATSLDLYSSIATNGLLFDDEVCDIVLRNNLKSVSFSIDGPDEGTHAQVRGPGLFARTVDKARRFVARRNKAGSHIRACLKPTYDVNTPLEQLEAMVRLGIDMGMDVVKFANPDRCIRRPDGHYGVSVEAHYKMAMFGADLREKYRRQITIVPINNPLTGCDEIGIPGMSGCIGAQELLTINPDGRLSPCLMHPVELGVLFKEHSSLRHFWNGSHRLRAFWDELKKPEKCGGCALHSRCRSGSVARRLVEQGERAEGGTTGRFSRTVDPLCPADYVQRHPEHAHRIGAGHSSGARFREIRVIHSL